MRAFLVAVLVMSTLPTQAQDSDEYQSLIAEAVAENAAGRYPEALVLFRRAHGINPNARTLRAMGAVSYEVRQYVDSVRWLEAALTDQRQPLTAEQRAEVQGVLERAYRFVGRIEVELDPGATLTVDGDPAESPLLLAIGEHELVASVGEREKSDILRIRGGEQRTVDMRLGELGGPVTVPVPEEPSHVPSSLAFGVGGVGVVLFAIGGGLGTAKRNELDGEMCAPNCEQDDVDQLRRQANIATSGLVIAGVGLAAGLILRFALERTPQVEVQASRSHAAIRWRRRF